MRVKIDGELYELEYKEFVRWVRAGKVPPDSMVWSQLLTDSEWRRAGDMIVFQRLSSDVDQGTIIPEIPFESILSARQEAEFALAQQRIPVLALSLIAMNLLVFGLQILAGGSNNLQALITMGAYSRYLILYAGEYWRLLTHIFLHIGFVHLFVNMVILLLLGQMLEGIYGRQRFLLLYFFSGFGGGIASLLFVKDQIGAGASGAIFGLMGTLVVFGLRYKDRIPLRRRRTFGLRLIPFLLIDLILGVLIPGVNIPAHIGGLLVGAVTAWLIPPKMFDERIESHQETRPIQIMANATILIMLLSGIAVALHIPDGEASTKAHYRPLYMKEVNYYEELLKTYPDNQELYRNLQKLYFDLRTLAPTESQWTDKLVQLYRLAIQQYPTDAVWYNNLAWLYVQDKTRDQEALSLAKRAVQLAPNQSNLLDTLAWCYLRSGDFEKSLLTFEEVLGLISNKDLDQTRDDIVGEIAESTLKGLKELIQAGLPRSEFDTFYQRIEPHLTDFPRWMNQLRKMRNGFGKRADKV